MEAAQGVRVGKVCGHGVGYFKLHFGDAHLAENSPQASIVATVISLAAYCHHILSCAVSCCEVLCCANAAMFWAACCVGYCAVPHAVPDTVALPHKCMLLCVFLYSCCA